MRVPACTVLLCLVLGPGCAGSHRKQAGADEFVGVTPIDLSDEQAELDELDGIELARVTEDCGNLLDLEPAARLGRLTEMQVRCLNKAMLDAQRQTAKDKLSRLLLGDAWAKGDVHRWMGIATRHLEDVERSDPDLVYQVAYTMVEIGNPDKMDLAVYWADTALERKDHWEGETHVRRVYGLYQIRTMAAYKHWEYLENQYRSKPSDALQQETERVRNEFKTYAREWLEFAKSSHRDTTEAMQLCAMAAGTEAFCHAP
ncbi:MAG: hypothetical protein R3F59_05365 [Myxococcota bacterium]